MKILLTQLFPIKFVNNIDNILSNFIMQHHQLLILRKYKYFIKLLYVFKIKICLFVMHNIDQKILYNFRDINEWKGKEILY